MPASAAWRSSGEAAACGPSVSDAHRTRHAALDAVDTASRPQLRAISVALDDQGESVPGRGTTTSVVWDEAVAPAASGPYVNSRSSVSRSALSRERDTSTKCLKVAVISAMRCEGRAALRPCRSLARRNFDSPGRPANERISDIAFREAPKARLYASANTGRETPAGAMRCEYAGTLGASSSEFSFTVRQPGKSRGLK